MILSSTETEYERIIEIGSDPIALSNLIHSQLISIVLESGDNEEIIKASKILLEIGVIDNLRKKFWAQQHGYDFPLTEETDMQYNLVYK